jgi:hypothetical protein
MARTTSAARVRELLAEAGGATKGRGRGYGAAARGEAVAYARSRMASGASLHAAAAEIGLRAQTLGRWLDVEHPAGFAEITIAREAPAVPATFTLVSPAGWRVEGLDIEALRAIVGARG